MVKRIVGIGLIITGMFGLALSLAGIILGGQVVDSLGLILADTVATTQINLKTVEGTLRQTKDTLKDVNQALQTTRQAVLDSSQALSQTQPLLDQAGQIASQKVPDGLDAVKASMPNIAAVSAAVEEALTKLSDFKVDRPFLGGRLNFDLGLTYEPPEPPIEQSLAQVEANLEELAASFRLLEKDLQAGSRNIGVISHDLETLGQNFGQINQGLAAFNPLLDDYLRVVNDFRSGLERLEATLTSRLAGIKLGLTLVMVWLGLTNLTPLYLGWRLLASPGV